jgi:hypothetical protein
MLVPEEFECVAAQPDKVTNRKAMTARSIAGGRRLIVRLPDGISNRRNDIRGISDTMKKLAENRSAHVVQKSRAARQEPCSMIAAPP